MEPKVTVPNFFLFLFPVMNILSAKHIQFGKEDSTWV